jgi:hypothetical protein
MASCESSDRTFCHFDLDKQFPVATLLLNASPPKKDEGMPDSEKYIPNKLTFQVSTEANSRVLDIRGALATELVAEFGLKEWSISENTVQAHNKGKDHAVVIGYNRYAMAKSDCTNDEYIELLRRLLGIMRNRNELSKETGIRRIGVRGLFFTAYRGGFEQLMNQFRKKFINVTPEGMNCFGSLTLKDIGAPLYFSSDKATVHFSCGPAKREEVKERHLREHEEDKLPLVGLLMDIDCFFAPETPTSLSLNAIEERIKDYVGECWSIHDKARKLIVS